MSAKLDISVKHNGKEVEIRTDSPLRKLPCGTAGIVVNGLVYAVYSDHSVELSDDGLPKAECPKFFRPGEEIAYSENSEAVSWYCYERTNRGQYIAFDGSEEFAVQLNATFEDVGLSRGFRESFRPAENGYFYDYYIRLEPHATERDIHKIAAGVENSNPEGSKDAGAAEVLRLVAEQFGGPKAFLEAWIEATNARSSLETKITEQRELVQAAQLRQKRSASELKLERQKRQDLNSALATERNISANLRDELDAARLNADELAAMGDDLRSEQMRSLVIDRDEAVEMAVEREAELETVEAEKRDLELDFREVKEREKVLKEKVEELEKENQMTFVGRIPQPDSAKKREKRILHELIHGVFPRLRLKDEDLRNLLTQFQSLKDVVEVLCALQNKRQPKSIKNWNGGKNLKGLVEVPGVGTGRKNQERMGRVYYRTTDDWKTVDVGVHIKKDEKEQEQFVKRRFS